MFAVAVLVALVPVPGASLAEQLRRDPVASLLGKEFAGKDFQKFARDLKLRHCSVVFGWGEPDSEPSYDFSADWRHNGFSIGVQDGKIDSITLSNTWKPEDTTAWAGKLPLGLSFSDTIQLVETRLGKTGKQPFIDMVKDHPRIRETMVSFPKYGMLITFHTDLDTGTETIHDLHLLYRPAP